MSDEQLDLVGDDIDRDRWAEHDADFTPPLVTRQGLTAIASIFGVPRRVWDPSAGAGIFGQVARSLWGDELELHANEVRSEELVHLDRHYDSVTIGDATTAQRTGFDAVATNPPWNQWTAIARAGWSAMGASGWMALLGPVAWGASFEAAEGLDLMCEIPPALELRIPGRIRFRTGTNPRTGRPYGSDHRKCAWWVWSKLATRHVAVPIFRSEPAMIAKWTTVVLPQLPAEALRWTTRPGTGSLPV